MQLLNSILLTLQIISSILIIVLVLLQQGKGADMGAAFGSGSAGSVFGSAGAANFLSRMTKWAAIVFFITTGGLAWVAHHPSSSPIESGIMSGFSESAKKAPAAPAAPTGTAVPNVPSKGTAPATTSAPAAGTAVPQGNAAAPAVPAAPVGDAVPSVPPAKK